MDRIIEFVTTHYILVFAFLALWGAFFVIESRRGGKAITPQFATNLVNQKDAVIVDVRAADEFREGHIPGSVNIPQSQVTDRMGELEKYKEKPLILTCKMGNQAAHLGRQLRNKGFSELYRIQGGVTAWRNDNLPVSKG